MTRKKSAQLVSMEQRIGDTQEPGYMVLNDVRAFIRRFCVFPNEQSLTAVTLWAAHTHSIEHFYTTPRLALLSPDPGSGKTRVLEVLDLLVANPMFSFNASTAAIFRTLHAGPVTLLFDEVDTIWRSKGRDDNNEELRGLLNAGYKRGVTIPRCVGTDFAVQHFPVFCAVALAGLGDLPDTIMSRSVIVRMRRRTQAEHVEPYNCRLHEAEGRRLRDRLAAFAERVGAHVSAKMPEFPDGVVDRPQEIWESLLSISVAAGGRWPVDAKEACSVLCAQSAEREPSLGIRLLGDLRTIFGRSELHALSTSFLLDELCSEHSGVDADAPWQTLNGKGISSRDLARLLKPYGVRPEKTRINGVPLQGYTRQSMLDPWERYLT